jgi:hypothetical protein
MSVTSLDTPFIEGGLHSTYYFNGRILSREDLQRDWDAERAIHERLGMALGEGIVRGFEVEAKVIGGDSIGNPVVTVSPGLALNRLGQAVALDRPVDVSLRKPTAIQSTGTSLAGSFNDCAPPEETVYVQGRGVYLLAVAPAQVKQGLALVSGLGNGTATCNVKEVVQGVQFRLLQVTGITAAELTDEAHLRNVVAYKFFFAAGVGTGAVRDPFGTAPAAPALTDSPLTDCDVPLAVLHWTTTGGLRWVDLWSVRRRVAPRTDGLLPGAPGAAVGEAMVMQFREQVTTMRAAGANLASVAASEVFAFLPPAGIVPITGVPGAVGFDLPTFFSGQAHRKPALIEGSLVASLFRDAASYAPIAAGNHELVWLYLVRENQQAVLTSNPPQPYLVFTSGDVPYQGNARFDLGKWGYASYAVGAPGGAP